MVSGEGGLGVQSDLLNFWPMWSVRGIPLSVSILPLCRIAVVPSIGIKRWSMWV
jgi:hypothetical protein